MQLIEFIYINATQKQNLEILIKKIQKKKIPDISSLVNTAVVNTKISAVVTKISGHVKYKYITTQEFKRLIAENFTERLKQANLLNKTDFDNELTSCHEKLPQIQLSIQKFKKKGKYSNNKTFT